MGLTQNQDTIKTLKMVLFLIVIEFLMLCASAVVLVAQNDFHSDTNALTNNFQPLDINNFKYYPYDPLNTNLNPSGSYYIQGTISQYLKGSYKDSVGHTFAVAEGDMVTLQEDIDKYNNENTGNSLDLLQFFFGAITFSIIPFPLNIIPTLISLIIGFIIGYFLYTEIKSWIPDWL